MILSNKYCSFWGKNDEKTNGANNICA